jgi:DNA-binding transcriptional ArsR family regulator
VSWDGDVNDAVVEEWVAETTPFERVHETLRTTTQPATAAELAERARVSEPTARKHAEALVDTGHAERVPDGRATRYRRSPSAVVLDRVEELRRDHSVDELVDAVDRLSGRVREYREETGVESPAALAETLDTGDEDGWGLLSRWRTTERNLAVARAALAHAEATDAVADDPEPA